MTWHQFFLRHRNMLIPSDALNAGLPLGLTDRRNEVFPILLSPSLEGESKGITRGAVVGSPLKYPGSFLPEQSPFWVTGGQAEARVM